MAGKLVLVGTPLGNRDDLSPRARAAIVGADVLLCEDTRSPLRLLGEGVTLPPRRSCFVGNEHEREAELVAMLAEGKTVAFVSEAGMPCWSDPGQRLVAAAVAAGHAVEVVPGPFAAAVGLVGSGMLEPSGRFCFEGFLPRKGPARRTRIAALVGEERTTVLYEAPHRLRSTLEDLRDALGADRRVALCRELTKLHEETWRGSLGDAVARCAEVEPRGEFVVVLAGAEPPPDATDDELRRSLDRELETGASRRDAAATVAARFDVAPNRVKRLLGG